MTLLKDLNEQDFVSFIKLRKEFTDLVNIYIETLPTTNTLNPLTVEDVAEDFKQFLKKNLSTYRVSIGIYDLSNKIQFDIEIYSSTHGIDVFPYITRNKIGRFKKIGLDKDFYGYKEANKELYGFSSVYELQDNLEELLKAS